MNIIVTGASSGIGFETVKKFAQEEGYSIIAIARRYDLLENLVNDCKNFKGRVIPIGFDLAKDDFSMLQEQISKNFKSVEILLNNVGQLVNAPFIDMQIEDVNSMLNVNFISLIKIIQLVTPLMTEEKSHIVNISSMAGFQGSQKYPGLSVYSATKAAVSALSESLAIEFASKNIFVNCLALGAVQTDMIHKAFPHYKAPINPFQIASFVADFCINGYKYFNGKILPVSLSTP